MFCQNPISIGNTIVLWCACTIITILFGFATGVNIGVNVVPVAIVMADNKSLVIVIIYARSTYHCFPH
jgi:hypothetical protein